MYEVAGCSFGGALLAYLWRRESKLKAQTLKSAIRVRDLRGLGQLLGGGRTSSLLVVVSGKVGSTEAFKSDRSGVLGVSLTEMAKLDFSMKNEAGKRERECEEVVLKRKRVPWFLEDNTGRVNVVGSFDFTFRRDVFDEPVNQLFERVLCRKGVEIIKHTCTEEVLEIGTPLTIVAKAYRDKDGAPSIRAQSSQVYNGSINIDYQISKLESDTAFYGYLSLFLACTGVFFCL